MANKNIKDYAKANNVYLWQVAKSLNVSVDTFTRKLREELSKEDEKHLKSIIDQLSKKGA